MKRKPTRVRRRSGTGRRTFLKGAASAALPIVFGCKSTETADAGLAPALITAPEKRLPPRCSRSG
jgi:hypothetical protein